MGWLKYAGSAGLILISLVVAASLSGCTPLGSSNTYTVTYNGAVFISGSAPVDANEYKTGDTVTVLGQSSLANGTFQFAGWTTSTTGPGSSYASGATFTMGTTNLTLYAVWVPANLIFSSAGSVIAITGNTLSSPGAVAIPGGVTSVDPDAFSSSSNVNAVTIPPSVTNIGHDAFYGAASLASVSFTSPSCVVSIGNDAFGSITSLTSVTIPSSVASIGTNVFYNCSNLTAVYENANTPPSLSAGSFSFSNVAAVFHIHVPTGTLAAYEGATGWHDYFTPTNYFVSP